MPGNVFAILCDRAGARACLETALVAALAIGAEPVRVLHVMIDPQSTILPTEEILTDDRRLAIERAEALERADLQATVAAVQHEGGAELLRWVEAFGREEPAVLAHARDARLFVMAVPPPHYAGVAQDALHAALMESGRPVLVVPPGGLPRTVKRMAVAWNDDAPCRRAVEAAEPWLRKADAIDVLHLDANRAAPSDEAQACMARLRLQATFRSVAWDERLPARRLLQAAGEADWLVMGAYRRGRLLDWVLGGITADVLDEARRPVFMMH